MPAILRPPHTPHTPHLRLWCFVAFHHQSLFRVFTSLVYVAVERPAGEASEAAAPPEQAAVAKEDEPAGPAALTKEEEPAVQGGDEVW